MMNKEERFRQILEENDERIRRICHYYHPNAEDRKDMYQEVLVNIWNSLDSFRGDAAISTWVYRVAVNTSLNYVRKDLRHMGLTVDAGHDRLHAIVDQGGPEQKLQQEACVERLQTELNLLPVMDKILVSLLLEGLSMKEMAGIIGITEPNVKVKLHRIKTHLRDKLKNTQP